MKDKSQNCNYRLYWLILIFLLIGLPSLAAILRISFYSQAPFGHWVEPYANACEETSILMVDSFYNKKNYDTKQANEQILKIVKIKNKFFGESLDESAQKIVDYINNFTNFEAFTKNNPTIEEIKKELDANRPIILPTFAKLLKNKYYNTANLDYHVLVISGYDNEKNEFVTQDPGTRHGANLRYPISMIMSAMRDLTPNKNIKKNPAVVVFTNPTISELSAKTDGDKDGLKKSEEILHKTDLTQKDTDSDGFSDGEEILNGYSPLVNENKITNNQLVRSEKTHEVFYLKDNKRFKILNEAELKKHGWNWSQVISVSENFLLKFPLAGDLD